MQFLNPIALWLAALAIPIILLYMLKLRRKQVQVSSTLLWIQLLRDQQANTPWQRLRRNLLLILQLIILAALVLSLARPSIETPAIASGSVIVLMDASASMNATDVSPSRFETARSTIRSLIDGLSGDSKMTLILAGQTPQTLVTAEGDKSLLRKALAQAEPMQGSSDWQAAFSLASAVARGSQAESTIVIVSDGGLPKTGLPSLPGEVRYVPIGSSDDNVAITALALRRSASSPQLFAEVTNFSGARRVVLISFYKDDELLDARQLDLPAGETQGMTLENLPNASGVYKAQISNSAQGNSPLDSFALDDAAFAVYQSTSARRVLLVSKGNLFLEQLLASLPGIQPFRALPAQNGTLQISSDPFDLYIFDGLILPELPAANLLLVNVPTNELFTVGESFDETGNVTVEDHALTRFVDWSNVHVLQAQKVQTPEWAEMLVNSEPGPLAFAGETGGRRVAALTFDLRESDLPLQVTFPILFSNLINYLIPPNAFDSTQSLHVGEHLEILTQPGVEQVVIASPSNQAFSFTPGENVITFTKTQELGFYAVNFLSKDSNSAAYFAVNLFDPIESDIRPQESIQVGQTAITPVVSEQVGLRELWPWLIGLALVILILEWQMFHHRQLPFLLTKVRRT
ncbi:MAG: BatA domain-containing protein [Chloroflexi bacterium]|nr:BatA domain-containing protein [Chloroflexota bacterium]